VLVFLGGVFIAHPGLASEAPPGAEVAAVAGYGVSNGVDVIGPGLGLRFGYGATNRLYAGVIGLIHFGSSDPGEPEVRHHSESLRLELGYEIDLLPLDLRPSLRGGITHIATPRDADGSVWSPDFGLGATLLVRLDGPFLGLDAEVRHLSSPIYNGDTVTVLGTVAGYWVFGYRF
jgi:hypothetical protein